MNNSNYNLNNNYLSRDEDYAISIVENMLNGVNEWKNIQDIVKSTIRTLTDVVKAQGFAIKELEKQLTNKASKVELLNGLGSKSNVNDVMKTFNEIAKNIEERPTIEEVQSLLEEKASKVEIQKVVNSRPTFDEVKTIINSKIESFVTIDHFHIEFKNQNEEINRHLYDNLKHYTLKRETDELIEKIEKKVNFLEFEEALNSKVNKDYVISALQRKVNKSDFDTFVTSKVEYQEFQELVSIVNNKADFEEIEKISSSFNSKVDRAEIIQMSNILSKKADIEDIENVVISVQEVKKENILKFSEFDKDIDKLIENIKKEFLNINNFLSDLNHYKADVKDLKSISVELTEKLNKENLTSAIKAVKDEIYDIINNERNESQILNNQYNDKLKQINESIKNLNEKLVESNSNNNNRKLEFNELNDEIKKIHSKLNSSLNDKNKDVVQDLYYLKDELLKLNCDIEDLANTKLNKDEILEFKQSVLTEINNKPSLSSLDNLYKSMMKELNDKLNENRDIMNKSLKKFEADFIKLLDRKANLFDVNSTINSKADIASTQVALQSKASVSDLDKIKNAVEKLIKDIGCKVENNKFEFFMNENKKILEDIKGDLLNRAAIHEVLALMKNKTDIDEVNKALTQIHNELDTKTALDQVRLN